MTATIEQRAWTRATTVTKVLSDTTALDKWKRRMVATGFARRPDLLSLAAASRGDKHALDAVCEDAMSAAGAGDRAERGTNLHTITETIDAGEHIDIPDEVVPDVVAYLTTCQAFGVRCHPDLIERVVVNPAVEVAGTFDRVVTIDQPWSVTMPGRPDPIVFPAGTQFIADLKTGANLSYGWGEIAQQLAIYANAPLMWRGRTTERDRYGRYLLPDAARHPDQYEPMTDVDLRFGLVVHLPAGEARCSLYLVDIEAGWDAATSAHWVRQWRSRRDLVGSVQIHHPQQEDSGVTRP